GADRRIVQLAQQLAFERKDTRLGNDVVQAGDEELATDDGDAGNDVLAFRDDRAPVLRLWIVDMDLHHAVIRRLVIRHHVEVIIGIHRREAALNAVNHFLDGRVRRAKVFRVDVHALRGNTVMHRDEEIAAVFGYLDAGELHG